VEEIPAGFGHALLLRDGGEIAQGLIAETITDENLTLTFDVPLKVGYDEGRFTARAA
jgi:iron complex transport system ATP-binding protein